MFGRKKHDCPGSLPSSDAHLSTQQVHRATRTRKIFSILTSVFLFISVIFVIMVEVGQTYNRSVLRDIYFIKLDLSHIIPAAVPNSVLINSIARTLGLHDFYSVGLWGYCEGYNGEGATNCSPPKMLYWFNPVEILQSELLAGASINLPADLNNILKLIRIVSNVMFGFYLAGACLSTVLIFIVPLSIYSRWASFAIAFFTFLAALFTTVATVIATVMFIIFRNVIKGVAEINLKASIGINMFALMWVAAAFSIFAWLIQTGLCCCCASRRDVKTGRKKGNKHAYTDTPPSETEKPKARRRFGFGKKTS
ncbi:integral membrane protein [Lophium mytilinum]|uniref:Integral membrane protein n=1 Tax=Lophium mytilinum TaxID=390894 RepID=A0A6A6QFC3_9PEZI|nr:integral membrane protein [Lophium mytilinum]